MRLLAAVALAALLIIATISAGLPDDALQVRDLLLNDPSNIEFDFNGDETVDVADLVIALNASNSIYLRPDIRFAAMEESVDFVSSLASMELTAKNASIMQWLDAHPLFDEYGLATDETVWATFTDGLPILFVDNRSHEEFPFLPLAPVMPAPQMSSSPLAPSDFTGEPSLDLPIFNPVYYDAELPFGRKVEIINAFGNGWQAETTADDLEFDFQTHKYQLGPVTQIGQANRTVSDLKNLNNVDVLYLGGHGGTGMFDNAPLSPGVTGSYFSVSTSDAVTRAELVALDADYRAKLIVPQINSSSRTASGTAIRGIYWAITENFITTHVSFGDPGRLGENALVVVDACSSSNSAFRQACMAKGAAVYFGWTVPVGDWGAAVSLDHLFGRLLGDDPMSVNSVGGVKTNVRPFDIDTIFNEMGLLRLINSGGSTLQVFRRSNSGLAILRPMLHTVHVFPETDQLYLYGIFGDNPTGASSGPKYPVVTVDGHEINVTEWRGWLIKCDLPSTGSGSIGNVVVKIDGVSSNPIPISEFSGVADFIERAIDTETQLMVPFVSGTYIYRSRMSIHPFRMKPNLNPVWPWIGISSLPPGDPEMTKMFLRHGEVFIVNPGSFERGASLVYQLNGQISYQSCTGTVAGEGEVVSYPVDPGSTSTPPNDVFSGVCNFFSTPEDPIVKWKLSMSSNGIDGTFLPGANCGTGSVDFELNSVFSTDDAEIIVDTDTFDIPAGEWTRSDGGQTIKWSAIGPCCGNSDNLPN